MTDRTFIQVGDPVGVVVGRLIRLERRKQDFTQKEMADKAEVSLVTYGGIESGKVDVSISTLKLICKALEISITVNKIKI